MNLNAFNNFNLRVYYRGLKSITTEVEDTIVKFSNNDTIEVKGNNIYLNGKLISNDPTLTDRELEELYKYHLTKKGYKFI